MRTVVIEFKCSVCQKAIGVDEKHTGQLIKCPSCQNPTRVSAATDGDASEPQAASVPAAAIAAEATLAHVPKAPANPIFPSCPSCQSELFNPSDTMCGVCGHLLEQTPATSSAPMTPRPAKTSPVVASLVPPTPAGLANGTPGVDVNAELPVNPAIASPYAKPTGTEFDGGYNAAYDYGKKTSEPTTSRSVGAWFAAVATGMFLAWIWGVIASFTGPIGQVFAWAIGAIVGCIAGLIARNPSLRFCLATTAGALLCMLFGRLVSTWVIMFTVSGMTAFSNLGHSLIPDTGVSIGVMEDMNNNGEFEGEEKDLVDLKIDAFFSNQELNDIKSYDEMEYETEAEVDRKVRTVVREMSDEDKQAMLKKVRAAHPGWMEEEWHFSAIIDSMVEGEELEDEEVRDHAVSKLRVLDGDSDEDYFRNTTRKQINERESKLRKVAMEKYASMDQQQKNDAIKQARLNHLAWNPVQHEYLAMLDTMSERDEIPEELKPMAKSAINLYLKLNYDDAFSEIEDGSVDFEQRQKLQSELHVLVNEQLLKLNQDEVDALVASTRKKYPAWQPLIGLEAFEELSGGLDEAIARFGSDGTFWSSLKTRFQMLDFIWLTLGMISAFAVVFTLGQSGKKS